MTPAEIRAQTTTELCALLLRIRARHPEVRSLMMGVAQYWADEADDAVHAHVIASTRDTPVWPHACDMWEDDTRVPLAGELCWSCADGGFENLNFDDNGDAIAGFEAFCTEDASQEETTATNYRPYAIARLRDDAVELEVVGIPQRDAYELLATDARAPTPWPDARAAELFAQVCAHATDDGPRHVLADHLLERGDPRGEYLALVLGHGLGHGLGHSDAARRDALLAAHRDAWLGPLARAIPEGGARFERGFLTHVEIMANEAPRAAVRGADAWGTVETLRYHPDSLGVLDAKMIALRELAGMCADDLPVLASAARPWAITSLHVDLATADQARQLAAVTTLPALRHLTIGGEAQDALSHLTTAPWWGQLERLTTIATSGPAIAKIPAAIGHIRTLAVVTLAVRDRPAGWALAYDTHTQTVDVSLVGWHPEATLASLGALLANTTSPIRLCASRCYQPVADDAALLARASGRQVTLA